jgi:hypothetical protein
VKAWLLAALLVPPSPSPGPADPTALLASLKTAWEARDANAYLALWNFTTPEARATEATFAQGLARWNAASFTVEGVGSRPQDGGRVRAAARSFSRSEPRAREDEWVFILENSSAGWKIVGRETVGSVEGLAHMSLDPQGYVATGRVLRFEDFELRMEEGTIFTSPADVGPTLLVFVGKGVVKVSPHPATERLVLRKYCGSPELQDTIQAAFIRIHPADLHHVLAPADLIPDPGAAGRLGLAREVFDSEINHSFVLDADLPGSPWWVYPGLGDALVAFRSAHQGTLTFTIFGSDQEAISLFDRAKRRQICLYPPQGRDLHYNEDLGREATILSHKIRARFDVEKGMLDAEDTINLRLLVPSHTLRLRLDDAFKLRSITSAEGALHPFFRVRDQSTVMVSLGADSGTTGTVTLRVSYIGYYRSGILDTESQGFRPGVSTNEGARPELTVDTPVVLTAKYPWYPQINSADFSLATIVADVPSSHRVVTSGQLVSERVEAGRRIVEYDLAQPGKYLALVVAHLSEAGQLNAAGVQVRAFVAPRIKQDAERVLQDTGEILAFYTKEFGPCPYSFLNLAVVESEDAGGHSPPGMVILAERPMFVKTTLRDDPGNFSDIRTFFLAHEIAHQWWGHGVAGANYHERWLSEGLAQYAAALWVRQKYGEEAFQGVLRRLGHWAEVGSPEGPISLGYRLIQVAKDSRAFRSVVYDKGAYVLFMLRALVGDGAVERALRALQSEHRFQKIGTLDLETAIQKESGQDVRGYVDEWVYGTRLPSVKVSQKTTREGKAYRTTVTLEGHDVPGPLPIEVIISTTEGDKSTRVTLSDEPASWTVETNSAPKKVRVNPDRALLVHVEGGGIS